MTPSITDILIVPHFLHQSAVWSIGLVVDDKRVYWSELTVPGYTSAAGAGSGPVAAVVSELQRATIAQPALGLNWTSWQKLLDEIDFREAPALRVSVEQALLAAVAAENQTSLVDVLVDAFGQATAPIREPSRLILEVENHLATAQVIETMIHLTPKGIGYRLSLGDMAASIGANAEYLQRFVRELSTLVVHQKMPAEAPLIYLGLNGALGRLVDDPRKDMGRILGLCAGLEQAAGTLPIWLEDPVLLDDEVANAASLFQLRDFMRMRTMGSQLVARAYTAAPGGLRLLCDTDAMDGVCLQVSEWGSLSGLADARERLRSHGKFTILKPGKLGSRRALEFYLDFAWALGVENVLLEMGQGGEVLAQDATLHVDRQHSWLNTKLGNRP